MLDAGIDVISTVNVQHLESLNDAIAELTEVRVRETFPDRILEEADEVVLVDLSPEELQERLRAGKVYPQASGPRSRWRTSSAPTSSSALRELALREVAEDVEARRRRSSLDPLSQQAVAERVLALVEPQPKSQRILRRAWRSAERLGAQLDALWVRRRAEPADRGGADRSSPRCAGSRSSSARTSSRRRATTSSRRVRRVAVRARLDLRLRRHARRDAAAARSSRLARLRARARAAGRRHPRRREPGRPAGVGVTE